MYACVLCKFGTSRRARQADNRLRSVQHDITMMSVGIGELQFAAMLFDDTSTDSETEAGTNEDRW